MISALNRLPNGTIEITITIPWNKIKNSYDEVLGGFLKKVTIKGFRKGKAPKKLVEEGTNKLKIYEEVLKKLVPQVYLEAVKEHHLKPIMSPQMRVLGTPEGKDWQIQTITCELPEISLGDYKTEVKKALAVDKIWVPGKAKKEKETKISQEEKMAKTFKILLETSRVQIPEILVQDEVNRMLSRLIDQTGKLGLTIEQYLVSVGKTIEKLKEEYRKQAEELLKLEFVLSAIADDLKIQISEAEVDKMIQATPDEQLRKNLNTPEQKSYIRQLLRKRQVIDNLSSL